MTDTTKYESELKAANKMDKTKSLTKFLNDNIFNDIDKIIGLSELRSLIKWVNKEFLNGSALHIILEDGNYEDGHLEYCKSSLLAGDYDKESKLIGNALTEDEKNKMLRLIELMEPLTEQEREMIDSGNVITEELFYTLYNKVVQAA